MFNFKTGIFILTIICIIPTGIAAYLGLAEKVL